MQAENNAVVKSSFGEIVKINVSFLAATAFGFLCLWMWPDVRFQYGWMFLAVACGAISLSFFSRAINSMSKLYKRNTALETFMQQGSRPKSSTMASDDAMKNAGMR